MRPRIVVLGAGRADLDRAAALDIELIAVTTPGRLAGCDIGHDPTVFVTDLGDPLIPAIVRAIHEQRPIAACLATDAAGLEPAARITDALRLSGFSARTVRGTRCRALLRSILNGISPVASRLCHTPAELVEFGYEVGFPLIIKSDKGTRLLNLPEQSAAVACPVFAEEYLRGPQYSIESFTFHGQHRAMAVTEQTTFGGDLGWFIPIAQAIPAPGAVLTQAWQLVAEALTALGVTEGPAHTELILTGTGPRILTVHPGLGPDRIPDLVHLSTGLDLDVLTLSWAARAEPPAAPPKAQVASAIHYLHAPPGRIANIHGTHRAHAQFGVVDVVISLGPGDHLRPLRTPADRPAHALAIGATVPSARANCVNALDHIRFEYGGPRWRPAPRRGAGSSLGTPRSGRRGPAGG